MLLPPGGVEADREGLLTFDEQFCPRRCDAGLVSCLAHVLCFVLQSDPVDSEAAVAVGVLDQSVIGACHFLTVLDASHDCVMWGNILKVTRIIILLLL